jgi:magnesium transporter
MASDDAAFPASALLLPEVLELLRESPEAVGEALAEAHSADISTLVEAMRAPERRALFAALPPAQAAAIIEYLDDAMQSDVLGLLDVPRGAAILAALPPDERADALGRFPAARVAALLGRMDPTLRAETHHLLTYDPETAGGLMTTEFVSMPDTTTVADALASMRGATLNKETVYSVYATDAEQRLSGVASLRDLLRAPAERSVSSVMNRSVVAVPADADQEEVARVISKYDLIALPVVDAERRLLGVVTVDDVLDVLVEESTEDVQKMGGVSPVEEPYLRAGFWLLAWKRAGWLLVFFVGELFTATVLRRYEEQLATTMSLVFFLPLIVACGGNAGAQSATLITRGLAVGDLHVRDVLRVSWRESAMGLALGTVLGAAGFARALLWGQPVSLAVVVGVTLVGVVMLGSLVGATLPLFFKRLGFDPAITSSPFVASLVDVLGLMLYLTVARLVIG